VYREQGRAGLLGLLKRSFDYKRIRSKTWYIPIALLMPAVLFLSYWLMRAMRMPLPEPNIPIIAVPVMLLAFFIGALGEELGWTGYATEPIERRWNALVAGVVLGVVWAVWHIVPFEQAHRARAWILWHCLFTVALRVLLVWIYINAGRSVFGVALTHALANVSMFLFPNYGSHYDPMVTCMFISPFAILAGISLRNKSKYELP
jgi:membrane protease YdiL (CAAX protease family)